MIRLGRCLRPLVPIALAAVMAGCASGRPVVTPRPTPGTSEAPREVNIIAREYRFDPDPIELAPGETVLLHLINAGLEVHEVVIGDGPVQDAWEAAEAATVGAPPGPTPLVSVAPGQAGLRVVLRSGERADVLWTVPAAPSLLIVGCHIPDHWTKGMRAGVAVLVPGGGRLPTVPRRAFRGWPVIPSGWPRADASGSAPGTAPRRGLEWLM